MLIRIRQCPALERWFQGVTCTCSSTQIRSANPAPADWKSCPVESWRGGKCRAYIESIPSPAGPLGGEIFWNERARVGPRGMCFYPMMDGSPAYIGRCDLLSLAAQASRGHARQTRCLGSSSTIGKPPLRNSATSASLRGFASSQTNSATLTMCCLLRSVARMRAGPGF